jgi:hypothetical protein
VRAPRGRAARTAHLQRLPLISSSPPSKRLSYYDPHGELVCFEPNHKKYNRKDEFIFVNKAEENKFFVANEVCYLIHSKWLHEWVEYCSTTNKTFCNSVQINGNTAITPNYANGIPTSFTSGNVITQSVSIQRITAGDVAANVIVLSAVTAWY